jgi:hypothetical protein
LELAYFVKEVMTRASYPVTFVVESSPRPDVSLLEVLTEIEISVIKLIGRLRHKRIAGSGINKVISKGVEMNVAITTNLSRLVSAEQTKKTEIRLLRDVLTEAAELCHGDGLTLTLDGLIISRPS